MQTPDNSHRLRRHSKPTPPQPEYSKKIIMSSPSSSPVRIDSSEIHHAPVAAGLSSLQYQQNTEILSQPSIGTLQQPITCKLAQSDMVEIALQIKERFIIQ